MSKKPREYEDDDGRTFADMNVEGMPWYDRREGSSFDRLFPQRKKGEDGFQLEPGQRRYVILGALLAVLAVAAVFGIVFFLAILGMDLFWN